MLADYEITTARLRLAPMTVEALDALIALDRAALEAEVGAAFPKPLAPPPETGDVLDFFRTIASPETLWSPRFIIVRDPALVVGSCGGMPPDLEGRCVFGYGVYLEHEGNGYATEAARGFIDAIRDHVDVTAVVSTIHPYNLASRRVAEKAGMGRTGEIEDAKEGRLEVWEVRTR